MVITLDPSAVCFAPAIEKLKDTADITLGENGILLKAEVSDTQLRVVLRNHEAVISYSRSCEFFRGLLLLLEHADEEVFSVTERASFAMNGEMIDNSRDSVLTVDAAKKLIHYSALLGLNSLLLYNEDTIEVQGHPYFGYMRMRYTKNEVQEIAQYAAEFGIELIPCIQVLAHMNQPLRWSCYHDIVDYGDIMMIGEEKTYQLIESIISAWRECTTSKWMNIGMDEAFQTGIGNYRKKHGDTNIFELLCRHLKRVIAICHKYEFQPMMWSDMFFQEAFGSYYSDDKISPELLAMVPKEIALCYWDYYTTDTQKYNSLFEKHKAFGNDIIFAGGAWKWSGVVPIMDYSHKASKLGLSAAKKNKVNKVFTTAWGEHGDSASVFNILPNMVLFAECDYSIGDDHAISKKVKLLTGYTLNEFFALSKPNHTSTGNQSCFANPPKYLFYQDILMGLFDCHTSTDFPEFFAECAQELEQLSQRDLPLSYLFRTISLFCRVLELKSCVGVWLKTAYDAGDRKKLIELADKIMPEILNRIHIYHNELRKQWLKESKAGGFDVQDIFLGGLKSRVEAAIWSVHAYLSGELRNIEELEQDRLPYDCQSLEKRGCLEVSCHGCNVWNMIVSPNVTAQFCYN